MNHSTHFNLKHLTRKKMPVKLMFLLLLCCGWAKSAPNAAQSVHFTVAYGDTAVLPCDGSSIVDEENTEVVWEAMGSDVASIKENIFTIEERYRDRVHFGSEEQTAAGDWSIILEDVMLSDSDMYECIYRGRRTLSTVWLTVQRPEVVSVMEVESDEDSTTLPCYLDLARKQPPDQLNVWWEKDGKVLLEKKGPTLSTYVEISPRDYNYFIPNNIDKFPLFLTTNTSVFSPGEFTCWYRTKESDDAKPGIPGTISLYIKEPIYETENSTESFTESSTESSTEEWGSASFWLLAFGTTEETPVTLNQGTSALQESTEPLPMEAQEETATSFPDGDLEEPESFNWDWDSDFPWVRTGLVAGVLLVTAVVLCILGALHKL